MKQISPQALFFPLIVVLLLTISGCATTISSAPPPANVFLLQDVQIVWVDKPLLRYIIKKQSRGYAAINAKEKKLAKNIINQLKVSFQKNVVTLIEQQLTSLGVSSGDKVILELTPVYASCFIGGGRSLQVRAKVKTSPTHTLWWTIIRVNGASSMEGLAFANNFAEKLMEELREAGWIN